MNFIIIRHYSLLLFAFIRFHSLLFAASLRLANVAQCGSVECRLSVPCRKGGSRGSPVRDFTNTLGRAVRCEPPSLPRLVGIIPVICTRYLGTCINNKLITVQAISGHKLLCSKPYHTAMTHDISYIIHDVRLIGTASNLKVVEHM